MDTDDYTEFAFIADNGVLISDTFESWRKKSNGIIVEVIDLSDRVDVLVADLYTGGVTPNFVTLTSAQAISGVKTFGAGTSVAPLLKIGSAGFYYDNSSGINTLTATSALRSVKLVNSGPTMNLRGIDYTLPTVAAYGSKFNILVSVSAGNQMSWRSMDDLVIGNSLGADSQGRLYVNQISSNEIVDYSIASYHIQDGAIVSSKLAIDSVTTPKIAAKQVTAAKIADNTITGAQMASGAIGNNQLATDAVTQVKMSANSVGNSEIIDGSIDASKIGGSNVPRQMVQDVKTNTSSFSGGWTDIGLQKNITVQAGANVRVQAVVNGASSDGDHGVAIRIVRNSTAIGLGGSSGSRVEAGAVIRTGGNVQIGCATIDFFDTPSSGTHTYKVQARTVAGTGYINRSLVDIDTNQCYRTISTLTLTELS